MIWWRGLAWWRRKSCISSNEVKRTKPEWHDGWVLHDVGGRLLKVWGGEELRRWWSAVRTIGNRNRNCGNNGGRLPLQGRLQGQGGQAGLKHVSSLFPVSLKGGLHVFQVWKFTHTPYFIDSLRPMRNNCQFLTPLNFPIALYGTQFCGSGITLFFFGSYMNFF